MLGKVPHQRRPALAPRHPVHATWRVLPHVWNLRSRRCFERGRDRFGFRLVHFSVQGNHIHLVVEAPGERALARGMQGLGSAWREHGKDPPVVAPRTWLLSIGWRMSADARLEILGDPARLHSSLPR
jgi:hypothetical protein